MGGRKRWSGEFCDLFASLFFLSVSFGSPLELLRGRERASEARGKEDERDASGLPLTRFDFFSSFPRRFWRAAGSGTA